MLVIKNSVIDFASILFLLRALCFERMTFQILKNIMISDREVTGSY